MKDTPPYNPALSLAQNAQMMNEALFGQNTIANPGILGACSSQPTQPVRKIHNVRAKCRPSGWDIQAQQGTPTFKPGANTWTRNIEIANARGSQYARGMIGSPCRSDASSALPGSYEHDPCPLHTPTVSQGTHDSKLGVHMPPPVTGELYYTTNTAEESSKEAQQGGSTKQAEEEQNSVLQDMLSQTSQKVMEQPQNAGNYENTMEKAEAPAFKAPRAP
jgi:hypothetical protein